MRTDLRSGREVSASVWLTGRGDHPSRGCGEGDRFQISYSPGETGDKHVDLCLGSKVQLCGVGVVVASQGAVGMDEWSFSLVMPATQAKVKSLGNVVAVDMGGWSVFKPAPLDGTHDIDRSVAVPVPATDGWWSYDPKKDVLQRSSAAGSASFHLMNKPVESFIVRRLSLLPGASPVFDLGPQEIVTVLPRWRLRFKVHRHGTDAKTVFGWMKLRALR